MLEQLLDLNLNVAKKIEAGEPVTSPGIPANYPDKEQLLSDDAFEKTNNQKEI